ncbi:MAG: flavodoxin family protein [Firmicutes bacterium]|jgi:flavodoxin|nr:flavodoxin family protein [Bacillota bacterium]
MKALVVYDSFFGNTKQVALAIGNALCSEGFFVKGSEGPLKDNELERASTWVKSVMKA